MTEKGYNLAKLPDGNLEVKFDTGEVFSGDPLEVTAKLAESRLTARGERDQWRQKAEAVPPPPPPPEPAPHVDTNEKATQDWLAKNTVAGIGLGTPEEVKAEWEQLKAFREQMEINNSVTQFYQMHPEYPGTKAANDAVQTIFNENPEWKLTPGNFEAAHLIALQRKMYDRVDPAAQTDNRATPPPMLRGSNPEMASGNPDPYAMPLADLRKAAITQELTRK
jgi:hypothetical protein